jgi:hypothetical protein
MICVSAARLPSLAETMTMRDEESPWKRARMTEGADWRGPEVGAHFVFITVNKPLTRWSGCRIWAGKADAKAAVGLQPKEVF